MNDAQSTNPRLPSDLGLPALGLVMQGVAGVFTGFGAFFFVFLLIAPTQFDGGARLMAIGVLVAGLVRGIAHLMAGREVARRSPQLQRAVRNYAITAGVTTALTIVLALVGTQLPLPPTLLVPFALASLAWPIALVLLVFRRRVTEAFAAAETFEVDLAPSDRSIEGAGVLMTLFGAFGLGLSLMGAYAALRMGTPPGLYGVLLVAVMAALVARSVIHVVAGVQASRGLRPTTFQARTTLYVTMAVISFALLAAFLLLISGGQGILLLMLLLPTLAFVLLAWPMAIRGFAQQAVMSDIGEGDGTVAFGVAPDRGLTAFGYWLVFYGSWSLATSVAQLIFVGSVGADALAALGGIAGHEVWMAPIEAGLALWAGLELVEMTPRYRVAAMVYGAAALVFLALRWPFFPDTEDVGIDFPLAMNLLFTAIALAMPIMAFVLISRRLPPAEAT
ncbi:MAG: hypothetical protein KC635_05315 [Myxococcales bacterium]|nr:hypothetical protein [Myxococcales bacterium]MCB9736736.1 hypothetical protein [Deltaproteobacteria bacterium]